MIEEARAEVVNVLVVEDDTGFPVPAGGLCIKGVEREDIEDLEVLDGNNVLDNPNCSPSTHTLRSVFSLAS